MRVLLADNDRVSCLIFADALNEWGHEVQEVHDGESAWEVLRGEESPRLALLDWLMPGLEGPEVCRRVRALGRREPPYLILVTSREAPQDIVAGLESGADDYVVKGNDLRELRARFHVGVRLVELQKALGDRLRRLEEALAQVQQLQGLLPICSYCKRIRDDQNYWQQVDAYVAAHSRLRFTHGVCPDCWEKEVKPQFQKAGIPLPERLSHPS
jgi:sigma-B regulation protein RsbU (phosphoserine phosphatase)